MKRKTSSINIKRKKQETERRSDHIGGSSSRSGKGRKVPLLTYILKAVAMHGDMGDGDDDDPTPPPPLPPPAAAAVLLLLMMMMMMALATAPLFKLSAAVEQQTEQSQRAARNFYCPLLLQPQRSPRAPTRQNTNRTSTNHRQNINRTSTDHRQNINRTSTDHQQNINRTSTDHQQNINRTSTEHQQNFDRISTALLALGFHSSTTLSPLFVFLFIFGVGLFSFFLFFFSLGLQHDRIYQQNIHRKS